MTHQPLRKLAIETKVLILTQEYLLGTLNPSQLGSLLDEIVADPRQRNDILAQAASGLRAQGVADETIRSLLDLWSKPLQSASVPKRPAPVSPVVPELPPPPPPTSQAPPDSKDLTVTRQMKSPFAVPYKDFKFGHGGKGRARPAEDPGTVAVPPPGGDAVAKGPIGSGASAPDRRSAPPQPDLPDCVLLAEDDQRIRQIYKIKFEQAGFAVAEAGDGLEVWNRLSLGGLGAVVLDMKLPSMHGMEILSRMNEAGMALPVAVCTAHDHLKNDPVIGVYPYVRFLVKPCPPEDVVGAVRKLLAQAREGA